MSNSYIISTTKIYYKQSLESIYNEYNSLSNTVANQEKGYKNIDYLNSIDDLKIDDVNIYKAEPDRGYQWISLVAVEKENDLYNAKIMRHCIRIEKITTNIINSCFPEYRYINNFLKYNKKLLAHFIIFNWNFNRCVISDGLANLNNKLKDFKYSVCVSYSGFLKVDTPMNKFMRFS